MADEIDLANEQADRWLSQALSNIGKNTARLTPRGNCYYCEAKFERAAPDFTLKLFCDADCSKDYEEEQRLKNRR